MRLRNWGIELRKFICGAFRGVIIHQCPALRTICKIFGEARACFICCGCPSSRCMTFWATNFNFWFVVKRLWGLSTHLRNNWKVITGNYSYCFICFLPRTRVSEISDPQGGVVGLTRPALRLNSTHSARNYLLILRAIYRCMQQHVNYIAIFVIQYECNNHSRI